MDISSDFYVDMFLTLVGYLAAVGLGAVVSLMLARRRKHSAVADQRQTIHLNQPSPRETTSPAPQFLHLGSRSTEARRPIVDSDAAATKGSDYRDRVDIIRIAREMLKAGADNKRIQQVLPVSEAELALLNLRNN